VPETEEYGISSFVFRARRPFHPERLDALVESALFSTGIRWTLEDASAAPAAEPAPPSMTPEVAAIVDGSAGFIVRSKGVAWVAGAAEEANAYVCNWSHAGRLVDLEPSRRWWAATPAEAWPTGMTHGHIPHWMDSDDVGDRQTEIVVIGLKMDHARMRAAFESCLVSDAEFAGGPAAWAEFEDPVLGDMDWVEHQAMLDEEEEEDADRIAEHDDEDDDEEHVHGPGCSHEHT
jgi:G3E family GTPase